MYELHLIVCICWGVELIINIMHGMYPLNIKSAMWLLRKATKINDRSGVV